MVFKSFIRKGQLPQCIYIGSPEAEAESTAQSRVQLFDVYEDYHNLFEQLSHEKFIVTGRKGCGKSAFGEYAYALSKREPNTWVKFIRQDQINLESLIQIGKDEGYSFDKENLFRWLIYTNILKLFSENNAIANNTDYELLRQFLQKNSGYVNIKKNEVQELIKKNGFDVNIDQFKRFFRTKFNRQIQIKEARAPFYKLLPHLEEVILKVLTSQEEKRNENSYVIFFDDLDIGFNIDNSESVDTLVNLVRVCRSINNEMFGKNDVTAKAVILIRDDISKYISSRFQDTAKIFSSYEAKIGWYQDSFHASHDENNLFIKQFINKRILHALTKAGISVSEDDPWSEFVTGDYSPKSSFKYIIDHTLFRPRDLILMFKPLETGQYRIPLNWHDVNSLIGQYSRQLVEELKNELSSFYENDKIEMIFSALEKIASTRDCSYQEALEIITQYCNTKQPQKILDDLFVRSIIGAIDPKNGFYKYKHREPINEIYSLSENDEIIVQNGVKASFYRR